MTPRSRKPVIIGAMRGLASDNYHQNFINFQMDEIDDTLESENSQKHLDSSLQRSKSESSLLLESPNESKSHLDSVEDPKTVITSNSDETLSTPFRYERILIKN